jgi:hypothetical protein
MKFFRLGCERRTNKWEVSAIPFVSNFAGLDESISSVLSGD